MAVYVARRVARHSGERTHRFDNHSTCANFSTFSNVYGTKDLRARPHQRALPNCGVAFAGLFAGAAQCDITHYGNIVFYQCCFANNNAAAMAQNKPVTKGCRRVNINPCHFGYAALQV